MSRFCVFLVDDDASVRKALGRLIRSFGYEVSIFASAAEVFTAMSHQKPDCLILDVQMPEMNGLDLVDQMLDADHVVPLIIISAYEDERIRERALQAGAIAFLQKPFNDQILLDALHVALAEITG